MEFESVWLRSIENFNRQFDKDVDEQEIIDCSINYASILNEYFFDMLKQEKKTYKLNVFYNNLSKVLRLFVNIEYNDERVQNMMNAYFVIKSFLEKYIDLNYYLYDELENIDISDRDTLIKYFCLYSVLEEFYINDFNKLDNYCNILEKNITSNFKINDFNENNLYVDKVCEFVRQKMMLLRGENNARRLSKNNK